MCCGTKRRVEVRCPDTCGYLNNAQMHPPAAVRRQEELDTAILVPGLSGLPQMGQQLLLLTVTMIDQARGHGLDAASDADVIDAVGALAQTYETAARGVIYEHRAGSIPAQRIAARIRAAYDEMGRSLPSSFASTAAGVLRRIEERVADAHRAGLDPQRGFLELAGRVAARFGPPPAAGPAESSPSPIILP